MVILQVKLIYCLVREAANLYYSRLKVDKNQNLSKSVMNYFIREARHVGMVMGLDTLRMMSSDIDVRSVSDFLVFKSLGVLGLPKELMFLYRLFEPNKLANMPLNKFAVLHRGGSVGMSEFKEIPWHKQEKEYILKVLDIKVSYGEELDYGEDRGSYTTISDYEHIQLVVDYVQGHSMGEIATTRGRSSTTVQKQIKEHNDNVMRVGYCPRCKRAGGELFESVVKKGKEIPKTEFSPQNSRARR